MKVLLSTRLYLIVVSNVLRGTIVARYCFIGKDALGNYVPATYLNLRTWLRGSDFSCAEIRGH